MFYSLAKIIPHLTVQVSEIVFKFESMKVNMYNIYLIYTEYLNESMSGTLLKLNFKTRRVI